MTLFRDNYPHNIEAPQRVYVQYSQDIDFDYSTGNYPLGETHEGFIWEYVYIPVEHTIGTTTLDRHVWMRWRIGEKESWTLPMRITDSFVNISSTDPEVDISSGSVSFRFKYTLANGDIVYSEYITLTNGIDGRGITTAAIVGTDLHFTYTDETEENLGRVVGYDGTGVPIGTTDYNYLVSIGDIPQWRDPLLMLNENLSGTSPIDYTNGVISHINTNGNKHIPIGGNNGDYLITNGSGVYTWTPNIDIPWTALDDTADVGDTDKLWSADKIATMFGSLATFGIKYAVALITDLAGIVGMSADDLCVVEEDRYVYKYDGATWNSFFALDGPHNHDDLYYRELELSVSGGGGAVHWDNITDKPSLYTDWTITGNIGSTDISNGETLSILGGAGATTSLVGNILTINASGTAYSAGSGLDLAGTVFSHENTSSVTNTSNLGGSVLRNLTFDTYGHVTSRSSLNLDGRYSLLSHYHSTLTRGTGLTGSNYNGSIARTWGVDFGTSTNTVSRGNHTHTGLYTISKASFTGGTAVKVNYYDGTSLVNIRFSYVHPTGILMNPLTWLTSVPAGYRPVQNIAQFATYTKTDGTQKDCLLRLYSANHATWPGRIMVGNFGEGGTMKIIGASFTFTIT